MSRITLAGIACFLVCLIQETTASDVVRTVPENARVPPTDMKVFVALRDFKLVAWYQGDKLLQVEFRKGMLTDQQMETVSRLSTLEAISLFTADVGDLGLEKLKNLKRLRHLNLRSTKITDAGLVHLKALTQLAHLVLSVTDITDAGLEHLAPLTALESLDLQATAVEGRGLRIVSHMPKLRYLVLPSTATNEALGHLKNLPHLGQLYVYTSRMHDSRITDDGLRNLENLRSLHTLVLSGANITDSGLKHLQGAIKRDRSNLHSVVVLFPWSTA